MIIRAEIVQIHSEWQEEDEDDGIEANIRLTIVPTTSSSSSTPPSSNLLSLGDILTRCGEVPLPPYLNRRAEKDDVQAYQNVFASNEAAGSYSLCCQHHLTHHLRTYSSPQYHSGSEAD